MSGDGGGITGLRQHYQSLLVFRERGIDAVSIDGAGDWVVRPINTEIQVVAHAAVDSVPGLGVMAVAKDGIYLIRGGFRGGAGFGSMSWGSSAVLHRVTERSPQSVFSLPVAPSRWRPETQAPISQTIQTIPGAPGDGWRWGIFD